MSTDMFTGDIRYAPTVTKTYIMAMFTEFAVPILQSESE